MNQELIKELAFKCIKEYAIKEVAKQTGLYKLSLLPDQVTHESLCDSFGIYYMHSIK